MKFYEFHDTKLSTIVENAYHALAIDEHRQDYMATLWNPDTAPQQKLEQRWFVGAHCDVGGGYKDRRLSDMTLSWMQDKGERARAGARPRASRGEKLSRRMDGLLRQVSRRPLCQKKSASLSAHRRH